MYVTTIFKSELENRFDVGYYNPKVVKVLKKLRKLAKSPEIDIVNLECIGKTKKGIFSISKSEYRQMGIPFIRVSNIKNLTIDKIDLAYISEELHKKEGKTRVTSGDLIVSKGGTIGEVAMIPEWMTEANISQDVIGVYLFNKSIAGHLSVYLASDMGKIQMEKAKTQQTHPHLTLTPLRKLKVPINKKLIKIISQKMQRATNYEKQMLLKIEKAKTVLHEYLQISTTFQDSKFFSINSNELRSKLFPNYYQPSYLKMIKDLKQKYNTVKLGKVAGIIDGDEVGSKNYQKKGVPFIRTSDFVNYGIDSTPYHKISKKTQKQFPQDVRSGDLLFTNDGKIGLCSMVVDGDKFVFQSHIKRVRVTDKRLTPEFIFIFLNTEYGRFQVQRMIFIQSTIPTIDRGLEEIIIPLIDRQVIDEITQLCIQAFECRKNRNILFQESKKLVNDFLESGIVSTDHLPDPELKYL